ncbi:hypothetical protein BT69DRAFT_1348844 [Atractiella rhizophila]|nr:hypothetical protein BT69DRAFT_1348844 [Atractiella rhizophila]
MDPFLTPKKPKRQSPSPPASASPSRSTHTTNASKRSPFTCSKSEILALGLGPPPRPKDPRLSKSMPFKSPPKRIRTGEESEDEELCPRKKSAFDSIQLSEFEIAEKSPGARNSSDLSRSLPLLSTPPSSPSKGQGQGQGSPVPPSLDALTKGLSSLSLTPDIFSSSTRSSGEKSTGRKISNPFLLSVFPIGSTSPRSVSASPALTASTISSPESGKSIFSSPFTNSPLNRSVSSVSSATKEPVKGGSPLDVGEGEEGEEEEWESDSAGSESTDMEEEVRSVEVAKVIGKRWRC